MFKSKRNRLAAEKVRREAEQRRQQELAVERRRSELHRERQQRFNEVWFGPCSG